MDEEEHERDGVEEDDEVRRRKAKMNKAKKAKKKRAKAKKEAETVPPKRVQTLEPAAPKQKQEETEDNLEFEDPYEDVFEEEDIVDAEDDEDVDEAGMKVEGEKDEDEEENQQNVYYAPSKHAEGEELEVDASAYGALHQMRFDWPAMSFDFFKDHMGQDRTRYPTSVWLAAGTQTDSGRGNELNLVRVSNIHRTKEEDEEGMVVLDDGEEEGEPTIESRKLDHPDGAVNRIRAMPQQPGIVACWSESGKVHLYDTRKTLQTLDLEMVAAGSAVAQRATPVFTMSKHKDEGFAMDWSPCRSGRLATGDCGKEIYVWDVGTSGGAGVTVDPSPFKGHMGSVEDLQWSPTEENVFASCSADGTVKIWDMRVKNRSMLTQAAHDQDVNVISWNHRVAYLLASGSDDCSFKVWDLRQLSQSQTAEPVGWFKGFHTDSITSIEWSPHDESVIACASADHQTTVWDLALEEDREFARQGADQGLSEDVLDENGRPVHFPPQLLFIHAGVRDPKELHFHPQIVGMIGVTGDSGFDLFVCEPLDPKSQLVKMD
jgi:ribosome assembly protein RRB1